MSKCMTIGRDFTILWTSPPDCLWYYDISRYVLEIHLGYLYISYRNNKAIDKQQEKMK